MFIFLGLGTGREFYWTTSCLLDRAAHCRVRTFLNAMRLKLDSSGVLSWVALGEMLLAALAFGFRDNQSPMRYTAATFPQERHCGAACHLNNRSISSLYLM